MTINHDDHIHKGKDFPVKDNRAKAGGRIIKPGSTASVDWDADLSLMGNHVMDDHYNVLVQTGLTITLQQAKARGSLSAIRKTQRRINLAVEGRLAIRSSWCPGCLNYLHNCCCPATDDARGASAASVSFMDNVYQHMEARENDFREQLDDARRERKRLKKLQRKAAERAARGSI